MFEYTLSELKIHWHYLFKITSGNLEVKNWHTIYDIIEEINCGDTTNLFQYKLNCLAALQEFDALMLNDPDINTKLEEKTMWEIIENFWKQLGKFIEDEENKTG